MKSLTNLFTVPCLFIFILTLSASKESNAQGQNSSVSEVIKYDQSYLIDVEQKIDSILSLLTLEEKDVKSY